jgi:carbamoyl-phosphate synthase/aspartate carbamoyltransferase
VISASTSYPSRGSIRYRGESASDSGRPGIYLVGSPWSGVDESLPVLLTAVDDRRLTLKSELEDIQERLHDNPIGIFGLPERVHIQVKVVVDRSFVFPKRGNYIDHFPQLSRSRLHCIERPFTASQFYWMAHLSHLRLGKSVSIAIVSPATEESATAHTVPSL